MAGPEKLVEKNIISFLESKGAFVWKVHGSMYQPAGMPDICCCFPDKNGIGRYLAIEVKRPKGGVVSELQKSKIRQIKNANGIAFVARSVEDVRNELSINGLIE